MAKQKVDQETEACPKCQGIGLVFGPDGSAEKCECNYWDNVKFRERHRRARIPVRFSRKTLSTFQAAKGDAVRQRIRQHAKAYADQFSPGEDRGLLLRGCTGCGKTHIAVAILIEAIRGGSTGLYQNVTDMLDELRRSYQRDADPSELGLLEEISNVDLLVLDDLGAEAITDWVRDRLYLIINRRYESALATIITTNSSDAELAERVGPRIVSRLYEMCDPFEEFPAQDYRAAHMR